MRAVGGGCGGCDRCDRRGDYSSRRRAAATAGRQSQRAPSVSAGRRGRLQSAASTAWPASMADFFEQPILNSPYERPGEHWELDGQPTAHQQAHRQPPARLLHRAGAQAAQTTAPASGNGAGPGCRRSQQRQSALRLGRPHQRLAPTARRLARVAGPPVAGDAANRPAAPALAVPLLPRHPAVLRVRGNAPGAVAPKACSEEWQGLAPLRLGELASGFRATAYTKPMR